MKSEHDRGPIGSWARRERLDREWSVEEVAAQLATVGQTIDVSYVRAIESGSKRPSRHVVDALARVYGSRPAGDRPEPATDIGALVAAIRDLVEEMRLARTAAQPDLAEVVALSVSAALQAAGARAG